MVFIYSVSIADACSAYLSKLMPGLLGPAVDFYCAAHSITQERYLSLAPLYYRGAHAAAVVYDITNPDSFEKAKYWIGELQKNASGAIGMRQQWDPSTPTIYFLVCKVSEALAVAGSCICT